MAPPESPIFSRLGTSSSPEFLQDPRELLAKGARVDLTDKFGNGPLWGAMQSEKGQYRVAAALIASGASATQKNNAGRSVQDFATVTNDSAMLQLLHGRRP